MITNKISALFDTTINKILMSTAEAVANDARANAPTARIRANITVTPITETPDGYKKITIQVSKNKESGAPEAPAYEFGSGIHSKSGQKYPIDAVNFPNLHFYWQREQRWFKGPHVDHPGVAARPFLAPALDKNRTTFRGLLARGVSALTRAVIDTGFHE